IEKIQELRNSGVPLYPPEFGGREPVASIKGRHEGIGHEKGEEQVCTAGRLYTVRNHGKPIFADHQDESGRIQLYLRKNDIGEEKFELFLRTIERGDIVGVRGHIFRTKVGEVTLWVDEITLLAKALCSLPEKFHGLKDIEKRYRQRYVDL